MKRFSLLGLLLIPLLCSAQSYIPVKNDSRIKVKPVIPVKAYAFDLRDVKLLPGSPLVHAMEMDSAYLLLLDPDRLLHRFYAHAGLPTKGPEYGGWEEEGLSGHTLGHYLSATSMMYASTGDTAFKNRVNYIVTELAQCQAARKTGYVGAIPNEDSIFYNVSIGGIKSGGFDLNGGWSPWYTVHKLMAGLVDAYLYCDNRQALKVVTGMADWTDNILKNLTEAQLQQMLRCEYGGMNDVLANIYAITGNKKYLALSYKFHDDFVMKPLSERIDPMPGKHSNTNVPKAIGSARQYELTGNAGDSTIASFFWQTMVHHHSYVIGGNSNYEYCGPEDQLNDRLSDNTCETCNTYNMLKLTRHLFSWQPSSQLGDYYERALYNHILASQNPKTGMMCYFVPLRMGTKKQFSDSFNTFTCCVGTGMENHSKYAEGIYYDGADGSLYVNFFIASRLNWKERHAVITQETAFPESDDVVFTVNTSHPQNFIIRIRKPHWATGVSLQVNEQAIDATAGEDGFITVGRTWKDGDQIKLTLKKELYTEHMPDNPDRIAILYGPLVLAGVLGDTMPDPVYGTPVLMTGDKQVDDWIRPVADASLTFQTTAVGKPRDVRLVPFYRVYDQYYTVYWDYFTPQRWSERQSEYAAEKERQHALELRTVDDFRIGEMQPERDHHLTSSDNSYVSDALGRNGREARAGGYFTFDMKVDTSVQNNLLLTYIGDDRDRVFDISINGTRIATETLTGSATGRFYDREYKIPSELIGGNSVIMVRIDAKHGKTAGRVFGVRTLRP